MGVDREAVVKRAEGLVRQGRLEAAIDEYVRLIQQQPQDWGALNSLGDLYARAGRAALAVEQYTRIADYHYSEGFFPKAQALYKKALKCHSTHEHTLRRLADIAARQGLLANARQYLQQLGEYTPSPAPPRPPVPLAGIEPVTSGIEPAVAFALLPSITEPGSSGLASSIGPEDSEIEAAVIINVADLPRLVEAVAPPPVSRDAVSLDSTLEVDLTDVLGALSADAPPARPLDEVFAEFRADATNAQRGPATAAQYEVALHLLRDGRADDALAAFAAAADSPALRFKAGTEVARLLTARGDLASAIEWFERAVDAPAPTPSARAAALYDLADVLEQIDEPARALAVLLELDADVPDFRDVGERLARLKDAPTVRTT